MIESDLIPYPESLTLTDLELRRFSAPNHAEFIFLISYYSLFKYLLMDVNDLATMETMRKAGRCATLYELLCESLGLDPMSPTTTWRDVAKAYSLTMEEAYKLSNPKEYETTKD